MPPMVHAPTANPRPAPLNRGEAALLRGHGLPDRWRGRDRFVVLQTGFGLGHAFLATLAAWRTDPAAGGRLFFLGLEPHPVAREDLVRAHAGQPLADLAQELQAQWPPRTAGWHRLDFARGRVQLLLGVGEMAELLAQTQAEVDAVFLAPFGPPGSWCERALAPLARLAAPGATLTAEGASPDLDAALKSAGFVPAAAGHEPGTMTQARFAPRHRPPGPAGLRPLAPAARDAVVLGAGLAGAACARALAEAGLDVQVIEAGPVADQASGNPGGLFHATVHADDGPHARWSRQAALRCRAWLHRHPPPWLRDGLLRLSPGEPLDQRLALAERLALDPQLAAPHADGWWFPSGGALPPRDWVKTLLADLPVRTHSPVATLLPLEDGRWRLLGASGAVVAETALLVLAPGAALPRLLAPLDADLAALLRPQRGQISWWPGQAGPDSPHAAGGYVLSLPDAGPLLAGATAQWQDDDPSVRQADHDHNRAVAERLLGRALPPPAGGRVGWRLLAPDKQPLVGGLIDPGQPAPTRATQPLHWPRRPGLVVCGALGSRGITSSPLAAELVVAQALGWPWPVPRNLAAAVDPARFTVRQVRRHALSNP